MSACGIEWRVVRRASLAWGKAAGSTAMKSPKVGLTHVAPRRSISLLMFRGSGRGAAGGREAFFALAPCVSPFFFALTGCRAPVPSCDLGFEWRTRGT